MKTHEKNTDSTTQTIILEAVVLREKINVWWKMVENEIWLDSKGVEGYAEKIRSDLDSTEAEKTFDDFWCRQLSINEHTPLSEKTLNEQNYLLPKTNKKQEANY